MPYKKYFSTRRTPQVTSANGTTANNAGGQAFKLDKWVQLDRFLILGCEGPSYYVEEREATIHNAGSVFSCSQKDGRRTVDRIAMVSLSGIAVKNNPALFALAICAGADDLKTRDYALSKLNEVARTGTHLFQFVDYIQNFRGWGRGLRRAIAHWYEAKHNKDLAYQLIKYKGRKGWTHRDVLRKCHAKTMDKNKAAMFEWVCRGKKSAKMPLLLSVPLTTVEEVLDAIRKYDLPREAVPTEYLNDVRIWTLLLTKMPVMAFLRNLGKMTSIGMDLTVEMRRQLSEQNLSKARIHPFSVLLALKTYASGQGFRGKLSWNAVAGVTNKLDNAFYQSFGSIEPTGKRLLLALDISSSMACQQINNTNITAREASAAMAMVTARQDDCIIVGFGHELVPLDISPRRRLDDNLGAISHLPFGPTDCAQPMLYAIRHHLKVDAFVIYTDNETWYGDIHPHQALRLYRETMGIPAKLIVVGMTATEFSIADPNDPGMLDVVGFDVSAAKLIETIIRT